jgi:large subunit ribosomal protein L11
MAKPKKPIKAKLKLQIKGGAANPAPPIGPALGQHGVNIMDFCKQYNDVTKDKAGMIIPAEITIYQDSTFSFITKMPPMSALIRQEAGLEKGSADPLREKVASLSKSQVEKIAETKMPDLNCDDLEMACHIVEGTARSMGVTMDYIKD